MPSPILKFGALALNPPLLLAPMAGLTHSALRAVIAGFGGCGLFSSEMLAANKLPRESADSPYLVRTATEYPLSCQLLAPDAESLPPAIARLERLGADAIDLNLGCPAPNVKKMGGGAALMAKPDTVREMVRTARRATGLPLSAKIRLGESLDSEGKAKLRDFCRMLADEGVDMLTVHARLKSEHFCRRPHWEWVAWVKEWVKVPVVANGGVDSVETARCCLQESGADGLMIGRAAAEKPWIFAEIAHALCGLPCPEILSLPDTYRAFASGLTVRFTPERRLGRLKEFSHHFASNYFFGHHLASRVQSSESFEEALERAEEFFATHPAENQRNI